MLYVLGTLLVIVILVVVAKVSGDLAVEEYKKELQIQEELRQRSKKSLFKNKTD